MDPKRSFRFAPKRLTLGWMLLGGAFLTWAFQAMPQDPKLDTTDPHLLTTAQYLYHFAKDNDWPASSKTGPFLIGVHNNPALVKVFADNYGAPPIGDQPLQFLSVEGGDATKGLHIFYTDAKDEDLRRQLGSFGINSGASGLASLPLSALSGGQRVRVVIARLAMEAPHLLLLDEPTNHLDLYSIDALSDALERFAGGIVLVSHNASLLEKVARDVYIVSGAKRTVQRFDGTVDEYLARVLGR